MIIEGRWQKKNRSFWDVGLKENVEDSMDSAKNERVNCKRTGWASKAERSMRENDAFSRFQILISIFTCSPTTTEDKTTHCVTFLYIRKIILFWIMSVVKNKKKKQLSTTKKPSKKAHQYLWIFSIHRHSNTLQYSHQEEYYTLTSTSTS